MEKKKKKKRKERVELKIEDANASKENKMKEDMLGCVLLVDIKVKIHVMTVHQVGSNFTFKK